MLTMRQDVLYGNSVTSEVKFKTVTSKSMGKIDGKNNYEESKYMRERPSLNIPILHSQFGCLYSGRFGRWSFSATSATSDHCLGHVILYHSFYPQFPRVVLLPSPHSLSACSYNLWP
ncbi:hypothetical protein M501DRAFT_53755 [Patellaria atrata CBS 101060]|uniref:Uncharacterized protein n=1 Tax=Patellaria atrata CBS 101060 TaxID=1346257 RepID=A0A9P4SJM0_9PEZI|nr:hypothetical protein M501DRAFT_53755 [Patellaria atrata CBS 101060]